MADQNQKVGADQLVGAGAPPQLAARLGDPQKLQGFFGGGRLIKLLGLLKTDGALVRRVITEVQTAIQSGDYMSLITLAQTEGPAVWEVVQNLLDILQPSPPAAA
jgi:hypothetical protein